jgi:polysaccharide pyruvyl transferase CsaB
MTASEELSKRETVALKRNLIVVSGYYGYDNLGDEAILEEIVGELAGLSQPEDVVILSRDPEKTKRQYGRQAANRWDLIKFSTMMRSTKLFISGGGGLFQDVRNLNSILFYGSQITLAHHAGAKVMVYAQGLGPLKHPISKLLTEKIWRQADAITIRDAPSQKLLNSWGLEAQQTADPVWRLKKTPLPETFATAFAKMTAGKTNSPLLVGLSLRPSPNFTSANMQILAQVLKDNLPDHAELLLLPLQADADRPTLEAFRQLCLKAHLCAEFLDTDLLTQPSHWLSLMEKFDLVIAMRLHALIMALKAGRPVIGMPYDPKVSDILQTFAQPAFKLEATENQKTDWSETLKESLTKMPELAQLARSTAEQMENKACKNFEILAKILQS